MLTVFTVVVRRQSSYFLHITYLLSSSAPVVLHINYTLINGWSRHYT